MRNRPLNDSDPEWLRGLASLPGAHSWVTELEPGDLEPTGLPDDRDPYDTTPLPALSTLNPCDECGTPIFDRDLATHARWHARHPV